MPGNALSTGPTNCRDGGPNGGGGWVRYENNGHHNQWQNNGNNNGPMNYSQQNHQPQQCQNDNGQSNIQHQGRTNNSQWQNNNNSQRNNKHYYNNNNNQRPPSQQPRQQSHSQSSQNSHSQTSSHHYSNHSAAPSQQSYKKGSTQYSVLYTHQKTKKKPTWKDGRLTITGHKATLYDASNSIIGCGDNVPLDSLEVSPSQISNLNSNSNLESEKYLIQIESVWTSNTTTNTNALNNKNIGMGLTQQSVNKGPSEGMKRLLNKKFVVPKRVIPNFDEMRRKRVEKENKRRRVLQPGELERMYGNNNCGDYYGDTREDYGGGYNVQNQNDGSSHGYGNQRQGYFGENGAGNDGDNANHHHSNNQSQNYRTNNAGPSRSFHRTNNDRESSEPMAFQSNGMDASGFYQEEDDDDDEEENDGYNPIGNNPNMEQEIRNTQHNEQCNQNNNEQYEQNDNSIHANNNSEEQSRSELPSCGNQSQDDQQVTNDLLALLGVTTTHHVQTASAAAVDAAPFQSNGTSNTRSHTNNPSSSNNTNIQNNANSAVDNTTANQAKSSFLSGLEEAEDDIDDDDRPAAFNFHRRDSYDESFNENDDSCNDDVPDNLDDERFNENDDSGGNENEAAEDETAAKSSAPITGLSLPDPGESSSDEDSLAE